MASTSSLKRSIHHITPLSNILLGNNECNLLDMEHTQHIDLHRVCDIKKGYQEKMSTLYAHVNNDILLSLSSVDELYKHLGYFFDSYERLPFEVRKEIGQKRKQIVTYHLNQRPPITNTDGDSYWKIRRNQIGQWGDIITHNDIEYIMEQDKAIVKDIVLHVIRRLKKHGIDEDFLTWSDEDFSLNNTTFRNYMIPVMLRGRGDKTNYFTSFSKEHKSIMNRAISEKGNSVRLARAHSNGKYILESDLQKKWYNVQHKYLLKVERIVKNEYGDILRNEYNKKIQQQLGDSIGKWNTLQNILEEEHYYVQKNHDFHSMHEESMLLIGKIGDKLKNILLEERVFV